MSEQNARLDPWLTEREAARYLAVSVHAMRFWRKAGKGPNFAALGRLIRYRRDDLDAFMLTRMVRGARSL